MAGTRTIQSLFLEVGQTISSKTLSTGHGVVLEIEAIWRGRTLFPGLTTYMETAIFGRLLDGGGRQIATNTLFIVPSYGKFRWFNPFIDVLVNSADTVSKLRLNAGNLPLGAFHGGLQAEAIAENFNVSVHDLQLKVVIMEFD